MLCLAPGFSVVLRTLLGLLQLYTGLLRDGRFCQQCPLSLGQLLAYLVDLLACLYIIGLQLLYARFCGLELLQQRICPLLIALCSPLGLVQLAAQLLKNEQEKVLETTH